MLMLKLLERGVNRSCLLLTTTTPATTTV